jgi:hypothetical protein
MTLLELDKLEKEIDSELIAINTIAADSKKESEIYNRYKIIHKAYINLIKNADSETQLEALKRAVYLQWISSFEPAHLTGVITSFWTLEKHENGLELEDFQFVYSVLDKLIGQNKLDKEFFEMLSYYASWEFVFEFANFKEYEKLHEFVFKVDPTKSYLNSIRQRNLNNRGQMGDYFSKP